jgi:hypothetical protein
MTSTHRETNIVFAADFADPILEPGKFRTVKFHRVIGSIQADLDPLVKFQSDYFLVLEIFPFASESSSINCENWKTLRE